MLGTSCREREAELIEPVTVPLRLSVPVENSSRLYSARRVIGDPGYAETLAAPQYVYIFAVVDNADGTQSVYTVIEKELDMTRWSRNTYTGSLRTEGDEVLTYERDITIPLTSQPRTAGRIYAAMSPVPLNLSNTSPATEAQVLNITYTVNDALQPHLQNVYSTPYNYDVNGEYYGKLNGITEKVPQARLMLYHVASKVDVMWAVPQDIRQQMKITGVTVKNLYQGEAYLFKPNALQHEMINAGYNITIAGNSPATWWEGRQYVYTIPYQTAAGKFPLQIDYGIQTATSDTYSLTLLKTINSSGAIFSPWLRCQMTFTAPKSGSETKNIE